MGPTATVTVHSQVDAEEARCVVAARAGDAEAMLRLLTRYRPPLLRLLVGMAGDLATAEDLVQEALLQAFRRIRQVRDPGCFYPWLRRLALRHALRRLGKRREAPLGESPEAAGVIDPMRGVETRLAVEEVLRALPVDLRVTLLLREVEGLDYQEIAATLGVPVGTVRSRLFAARRQFRARWQAMEEEPV
jgi:RNA polymerase sigma-70 factor (ECF subfamily)